MKTSKAAASLFSFCRRGDILCDALFFAAGAVLGSCTSGLTLTGMSIQLTDPAMLTADGFFAFLLSGCRLPLLALVFSVFLPGFLLIPGVSFLYSYTCSLSFYMCFTSGAAFDAYAAYLILFLLTAPVSLMLFAQCQWISRLHFQVVSGRRSSGEGGIRAYLVILILLTVLCLVHLLFYFILQVGR